MIDTNQNFPLGFYKTGDKVFTSKIQAVEYAATINNAEVYWFFNDEVFSKVDWVNEPSSSLTEFYRQRALQIREKYDYVIVMFSGGADSTNVLNSFLHNGIHVDEIVASAPISGLNKWNYNNTDTSVVNMVSETKYSQFEYLKEVASKFPRIKITINDYFLEMINYCSDERWLDDCYVFISPSVVRASLNQLDHIKDMCEKGLRIAKVFGMDKPSLVEHKGDVFCSFIDIPLGIMQHVSFRERYLSIEPVAFYWTPDLPQMVVKQAQTLARWIYRPENAYVNKTMLRYTDPVDWINSERRQSDYHRGIVPTIYPDLQFTTVFQTDKMFTNETCMVHDKIWLNTHHSDMKVVHDITHMILKKLKSLPKKYVADHANLSLKPHRKYYKLGPVHKYKLNKEIIL